MSRSRRWGGRFSLALAVWAAVVGVIGLARFLLDHQLLTVFFAVANLVAFRMNIAAYFRVRAER